MVENLCSEVINSRSEVSKASRGTKIVKEGYGHAYLLNADEAAELATRIVTTKYNNSIKKIKEVTNT